MKYMLCFLTALALLLALPACTSPHKPDETAGPQDSEDAVLAPDFAVLDASGGTLHLSDLRGTPVVLNFWASWCPPCKAEMPDFEEMYKLYGDRVEFLMVNLTDGQRETMDLAKAHVADNGYTFPVYFDTASLAAEAYRISSIPTTYFISADGTIVSGASGMLDAASLEEGICSILGD